MTTEAGKKTWWEGGFFPRVFKGNMALNFGLPVSRTIRKLTTVVLSLPVCNTLLHSLRKLIHKVSDNPLKGFKCEVYQE